MRFIWTVPLLFLLNGCIGLAVPPAITAISYAADGVSVLFSGKSVTDHAISEVAGYDCVMWRLVELKYPCREYVEEDLGLEPEETIAEGAPGVVGSDRAVPVVGVSSVSERAVSAKLRPVSRLPAPQSRITDPMARPPPRDASTTGLQPWARLPIQHVRLRRGRRIVLGSFTNRPNAARFARKYGRLGAVIAPAAVDGVVHFRVLTAALTPGETRTMLRRARSSGLAGVWIAPACGAPDICGDAALQITDAAPGGAGG